MTPEDELAFRRMREARVKVSVVCKQFGFSSTTYYNVCRRLDGLPLKVKPKKSEGDTDKPMCVCGGRLRFETANGFAYSLCRSCGQTQGIATRGVRKHDQRERLEQYFAEEEYRSERFTPENHKPGKDPSLKVGKQDPLLRDVA